MEDTMIERVARALCYDDDDNPDEIIQGRPRWRFKVAAAHGAIAAMREPTDEMLHRAFVTMNATPSGTW